MGKRIKKTIAHGALVPIALTLILIVGTMASAGQPTPPLPGAPNYINIDVPKAHEIVTNNPEQIILLDVRTEGEYNTEHIPGSINIPLHDLESRLDKLNKSKVVIVYCQSGRRSRIASEILAEHGFAVYNMLGGLNAWKEKFATSVGTPVPSPTPTVAPELTPSPAAASPAPITSPSVPPAASPPPVTSPVTTPVPEEKRQIPGFGIISWITAISISLLGWSLLGKRRSWRRES